MAFEINPKRLSLQDCAGMQLVELIRSLWEEIENREPSDITPYDSPPEPLGTEAQAGTNSKYARGDHVHPKPSATDIGAQPATVVVTVSGTTPTIIAEDNHQYICGEVATLDLTPPASGICDVIFTSGSTATVLTVPSTIRWAGGFDPTALDAGTTYEVNIMDGLGVTASWT